VGRQRRSFYGAKRWGRGEAQRRCRNAGAGSGADGAPKRGVLGKFSHVSGKHRPATPPPPAEGGPPAVVAGSSGDGSSADHGRWPPRLVAGSAAGGARRRPRQALPPSESDGSGGPPRVSVRRQRRLIRTPSGIARIVNYTRGRPDMDGLTKYLSRPRTCGCRAWTTATMGGGTHHRHWRRSVPPRGPADDGNARSLARGCPRPRWWVDQPGRPRGAVCAARQRLGGRARRRAAALGLAENPYLYVSDFRTCVQLS